MIEFVKKHILIVALILLLIGLLSYILVRNCLASKSRYIESGLLETTYEMVPKKYEVNEYTNITISDEDMAKIYFQDYLNRVGVNIENSYYLLDEEYRNTKFGSVNNYINYLNGLYFYNTVDSYYKTRSNGYVIYGVYDVNGNQFIFKTDGVMQYSVYFDSDTVEIW